ncbi:hypothetical protein [Pantoea sp. B65]
MITVAEKMKTYRLRKVWSQEQLAEVASLPQKGDDVAVHLY